MTFGNNNYNNYITGSQSAAMTLLPLSHPSSFTSFPRSVMQFSLVPPLGSTPVHPIYLIISPVDVRHAPSIAASEPSTHTSLFGPSLDRMKAWMASSFWADDTRAKRPPIAWQFAWAVDWVTDPMRRR